MTEQNSIRKFRLLIREAYANGYQAGRTAERQSQIDKNADMLIAALESGELNVTMQVSETAKAHYHVEPIGYSEEFRGPGNGKVTTDIS